MPDTFQLAVYAGDFGTVMPISIYLQQRQAGIATWVPNLSSTTILLHTQEREWLASNWSMGNLHVLILQFEAAHDRLRQGQFAVIRSAALEEPEVPYLLIEPDENLTEVYLSTCFLAHTSLAYAFPIPRFPGQPTQAEALYTYVQQHRAEILHPIQGLAQNQHFTELPYLYLNLIESLQQEAQTGRQLYAQLGIDYIT